MHLRHLRHFVIAAEEVHMHRAAARAGIAQPALTQRIKAMEQELGVVLFARSGRGVVLTDAGRAMLERARRILDQFDNAVSLVRDIEAGRVGALRIGFTESSSFSLVLTEVLPAFRAAWPDIKLELSEDHTESLIESLGHDRLDLAFVRPPIPPAAQVDYEPLVEEALFAAVPVTHRLASRPAIGLAELRDEPFIVYPRRRATGLSDRILARCREMGFLPKIVQQTPQLSATVNLVAASMGVAIVPDCMRNMRAESVRYLPITDAGFTAQLGIAFSRDAAGTAIGHFLAIARGRKSMSAEH